MGNSRRIALFAICVLAAFVQGWIVLKVHAVGIWLLYFGIVGAAPFLVLNGVHGDAEGLPGIVGGVPYVLTNGVVYYWIVTLILRLKSRRQRRSRSRRLG
jgi:hypothetical protein